jgi:hypothetical protein
MFRDVINIIVLITIYNVRIKKHKRLLDIDILIGEVYIVSSAEIV